MNLPLSGHRAYTRSAVRRSLWSLRVRCAPRDLYSKLSDPTIDWGVETILNRLEGYPALPFSTHSDYVRESCKKVGISFSRTLYGCFLRFPIILVLVVLLCPISRQNFIVHSSNIKVPCFRKTPDQYLIVKASIFPLRVRCRGVCAGRLCRVRNPLG